jgi:soluble lytic murein transglycosylase-like protein
MTRTIPAVLALLAAICTSSVARASADATNACEREIGRAAKVHDVPVSVFYAVGLTETGRKGSLQPYALNVEGRAYFAADLRDALRRFDEARAQNARLIDVGCMQINHHYHGTSFRSVSEMFDPRRNIEYAALFLKKLKQREGTWTLAVARYHAGPDNNPAQKRYVCAVITNMVATGFGQWTPNARSFCQ